MSLLRFRCKHRYATGFELDLTFETDHLFSTLFGPSGSGKSSVLKMIAGSLAAEEGKVWIGDRLVYDASASFSMAAEKRNIGFVFQEALLFPHLCVEKNLRYGEGRLRKNSRNIRFSHVVEVLELGSLLKRYPKNLSGGEKQRVGLGRALLSGPELMLMDEPLASLDGPLKGRVLGYLERAVKEWEIPTLFVTHSQAEVRRAASWVVVIDKGRMVCSGPPEEALGGVTPLSWSNGTGPVNLLRIEGIAKENGLATTSVNGQEMLLPRLKGEGEGNPAFIQFRPADTILSRRDVLGLSVRNQLHGTVRQILVVESTVFVAIDIGQLFWAEITQQAATELELEVGCKVTCLLKTQSLRLVE